MAGTPLGARAPEPLASLPAPAGATYPTTAAASAARAPGRIPATSRTRRVVGVFNLGTELVVVYASRSAREAAAVTVEVGDGAQRLAGELSPAQARSLARALVVAAETADSTQRRPHVERYPFRADDAVTLAGGAQ